MCFCACRSPAVPPPRESTYLNSAVPVRPRPTYENGEAPGRPARRRRSDEGLPAPPADRWPSVLRAVMEAGAVEGRKGALHGGASSFSCSERRRRRRDLLAGVSPAAGAAVGGRYGVTVVLPGLRRRAASTCGRGCLGPGPEGGTAARTPPAARPALTPRCPARGCGPPRGQAKQRGWRLLPSPWRGPAPAIGPPQLRGPVPRAGAPACRGV